jgi:serine phosphatase RsbU (regulator of sigma subunit)
MNRLFMKQLLLAVLLLFPGYAFSSIITLSDGTNEYAASTALDILEDKSGTITIDDILSGKYNDQFAPSPGLNPAYSQTESAYWVRLNINNNSNTDEWLLEMRNGYASVIDLYVPLGNNVYKEVKGGFFLPFDRSRHYAYEFYTQKLQIAKGETKTYYLRIKSPTPILMAWYLVSHERFIQRATVLEYMLGLYYGIIIVLFIYSIFNFIALRNRSYLWYGLYVISIAGLVFCIDGRMFRFITSSYPYFNLKLLDMIMTFSVVFGLAYGKSFLDTKKYVPVLHKVIKIVIGIMVLLGLVIIPFCSVEIGVAIAKAVPIPAMILIMLAAWLCYRRGHKPAGLFLVGFGVFAIGGSITNLAFAAVIPSNVFTLYAIHAGSALEAIILVFGLSQQMRLMKHEKESAQEAIIHQLKENEQLQTKVNRELEEKVRERTSEIESQKLLIEEKNKDILDSILYARRIQQAILPDDHYLEKILKDHFVLYKPKDIVSGDFYWAEDKKDSSLFAAVDCTGHGVPGAFVSMLGYNGLNQAVNEKGLTDPGAILSELDGYMHQALKHSMHHTNVKDGMDISLCRIDWSKRKLYFAGAVNPAYIVRNGEIIILKGDRFPIGGELEETKSFTTQQFDLQDGDAVYIFSDGYADQFGGEKGKKFMSKQFKDLLLRMNREQMKQQAQMLDDTLSKWRGELEQVDDVLVIGVRI